MKDGFMMAYRENTAWRMAANLEVTRSGFYAWLRRERAERQAADEHRRDLIEAIQKEVRYRYGSPRMRGNCVGEVDGSATTMWHG